MPNQFQPFDFIDIDDFLESLPEHERVIVDHLRNLVFECLPNCKEKLSWNVPFYSINKQICFIWPASVPWGKPKKEGVEFGFNKGYLMRDELNYLERGNRKHVFTKRFRSLDEIDFEILRMYLFEALGVDELHGKKS